MFSIGNDELKDKPHLGKTIKCKQCGEEHQVKYGKRILPDGSEIEDKMLAFYNCQGKAYLAGIDGKAI